MTASDDHAWVEALVREHLAALRGYLASLGAHPDLLDDVAQEVFIAVFRERERYDPERPIRAWIFGIARNVLHQEFRKQRLEARVRHGAAAARLFATADESLAHHEAHAGGDALAALSLCLGALGERARRLVSLHYQDQMPTRAIAATVGMQDTAVRVSLLRAREALRLCVERRLTGAGS